MKKNTIFTLSLSLLFAGSVMAQGIHPDNANPPSFPVPANSGVRADPEVFLQGDFFEIGINQSGSFGSANSAPVGYHEVGRSNLGFIADYDKNGWTTGTPNHSGDYFLPGSPYEAWLVEFDQGATEYSFRNGERTGNFDIPQTSLTNTSSGTTNSAVWVGTATGGPNTLLVEQEVYFDDSDIFFLFDITLTNTGPNTLTDVEYVRDVDPDQEVDFGGTNTTVNYVVSQPGGGNNEAVVIANGNRWGVPMGLGTVHPNAMVTVNPDGNLQINDADDVFDRTYAPTQAAPNVSDRGVSCGLRFPELAPGESVSFSMAYVLNEEDIGNIGEIIKPGPPEGKIPVSNWALGLGIFLIIAVSVIRMRRMA